MLAPAATSPVATVVLWIIVGYFAVCAPFCAALLIGAAVRNHNAVRLAREQLRRAENLAHARAERDRRRRAEILTLERIPVLPYDPERLR